MAEAAEKKFQVRRASVGGSNSRMSNRRRMQHLVQSKPTFVKEFPDNSRGMEGDIVFWENKNNYNKIEQFLKHKGQWINITLGRPANDSQKIKMGKS
jgi:hypothetical protein